MKTNSIKNLKFLKLLFIAITLSTFNSISAQPRGSGGIGKISVWREGSSIKSVQIDTRYSNKYDLEVYQGDKVVFEADDAGSQPPPAVHGLTDTNVMRWAGECIFMENDFSQGSSKPFLFFDSNVHGVKKRPYPKSWAGNKHLYPIFSNTALGKKSLTWYANGRSEFAYFIKPSTYNINSYFSSYKELLNGGLFPNSNKFFGPKSPSIRRQRNNQKEGLNMELLRAYNNYEDFVAGLDPDELIYNNLNSSEIVKNDNSTSKKFDYVADDQWKIFGDLKWYQTINDAMYAFLKGTQNNNNRIYKEISDNNLYIYKNGTELIENKLFNNDVPQPMFNNKRPVYYNPDSRNSPIIKNTILNFYIKGRKCDINLAVLSPLEGPRGGKRAYDKLSEYERRNPIVNFYGIIDGPIHVARFQQNVKYSVQGLPWRTEMGDRVFYLVYTYEDSYGIMQEQRKVVTKNNPTVWFNIQGGGYHDLTLRYKADFLDSDKAAEVIIAGKELIDIDLRFIFAPSNSDNPQKSDYSYNPEETLKGIKLNENKGNGKNWFLGDNNTKLKDNNYGLNHGYKDHNVVRTYTLKSDDTMTLTVLDADPHSFVHYQPDFYLSERRLSKRLSYSYLTNNYDTKLEWIAAKDKDFSIDVKSSLAFGRYYTFSPSSIWGSAYQGDIYIKAVYNNTSEIAVKIVQSTTTGNIDDIILPSSTQNLGNVMEYDLSEDQFALLKAIAPDFYSLSENEKDRFKIFKVKDILSAYTYGEKQMGYANLANRYDNVGEHTRFSDMNNYNNTFSWTFQTYNDAITDQNFIYYDFSKDASYEQYLKNYQNTWFPAYWVRHLDSKELSKEIPENGDSRIREFPQAATLNQSLATYNKGKVPYEPWQVRLPWISQTAQGYKARWNIKCIYDVEQLFGSIGIPVTTSVSDYSSNVLGTDGSKIIDGFDAKQREMQEFYYMLKNKEIIVVDKSYLYVKVRRNGEYSACKIKVVDSGNNKIYEGTLGQIQRYNPQKLAERKKEASIPINDNGALCTVYPNPNSVGIFSIDINVPQENSNVDLQLSDLNGKIIYNSLPKVVNGRYSTTIGENLNLPKGVYLLTIKVNDLIETKKLIVN